MFNFRNLILNDKFVINIYQDNINVLNYEKIGIVDDSKISIFSNKGEIVIFGNNLVLNKMLDDEVLIKGQFTKIEYR